MPGSPLRYNIDFQNIIINIVAIAFLIFDIFERKTIKFNTLDIVIVLLSFSTFVPLIFNSYLRLCDTVEYILRYISALNIYFITRKYLQSDSDKTQLIMKVLTGLSIAVILVGIDMMSFNFLDKFYNFLRTPIVLNEQKLRMSSFFKYPNTFGVFIVVSIFIAIGLYLNEPGKKKWIYGCCLMMQIFALISSYSRLCWGISFALIICYIFYIKEKKKEILKVLLISFVNAFLYFCIFNLLITKNNFVIIALSLICINIWQYLCIKFLIQQNIVKKYVKNKKILAVVLFVFIVFFGISIIPKKSVIIFNSEQDKNNYGIRNIQVDKNKDYKLKINIETQSEKKDNFVIFVKQLDNDGQLIHEEKLLLDNFNGIKEIDFKTNTKTDLLSIVFKCFEPNNNTKLVLHSITINDNNIATNYGLIPINLINRLKDFKITASSSNNRLNYIKEAIKLIFKENIIFGLGGNAWKYAETKNIVPQTIAEHCFPLQLFIQNGIIGFVLYIFIIVLLFNIYKKIKNEQFNLYKISIFFALISIFIHSLLDFDMYFQIILLEMYMFMAILNNSPQKENKKLKITKPIYAILLVVFLYINIGEFVTLHFMNTDNIKSDYEKLRIINAKIALSPYYYKFYNDRANCLYSIKNKGYSTTKFEIESRIINDIKFLTDIEKIKDVSLL